MSAPVLEIRHLRLVRAVADEGGPTRAAARLHLTQSAVSHQLAELEGRLGVPLFARVRRRLVPTPAGARLIDEARSILSELTRVERELYRSGERRRETVRVVMETFTSYHWLPPIAGALAKEAPHVETQIVLAAAREPLAALLRGTVDVALVSAPVRERAVLSAPLRADEWAVIAAPSHRFADAAYVTATALGQETVLAHDATRSDVERLRELVLAERAPMPRVVNVPLTCALVELVAAGLGVGLVSRWAVEPHLARGDIIARRFSRAGLAESWSLLWRKDADAAPHVRRFVELARAHLAQPSPRRRRPRASRGGRARR
jgi:LysR family transcriptional regulator for metE and metH